MKFLSKHIDSRFSFAWLLSGFLNPAQETRAGDFSARVPSWLYALQLVVRGQIRAWRTRYDVRNAAVGKSYVSHGFFGLWRQHYQCSWADWQVGSPPASKGEKIVCVFR